MEPEEEDVPPEAYESWRKNDGCGGGGGGGASVAEYEEE